MHSRHLLKHVDPPEIYLFATPRCRPCELGG